MTDKIRVAVATYTNTLPFLRGIQSSVLLDDEAELMMDYPSACADLVINGKADIGIIPIQALLDIPEYHIVSDYCIGANGAVDSVFVFSDMPIVDIKVLRLDKQSKTSNGLARILLKYFWKKDVELVQDGEADAFVLIGDRTFGQKEHYPYAYDLGFYWKEFTGLPFVFAVWASNKVLTDSFCAAFNKALGEGLMMIDDIIAELPSHANFDYADYLKHRLDFHLTAEKRQAIERYLELYRSL